jgi:hypothetical protein
MQLPELHLGDGFDDELPCAAAVEGPAAGSIARSDNARAKTVPVPRIMDSPSNSGRPDFFCDVGQRLCEFRRRYAEIAGKVVVCTWVATTNNR